MARELRKQEVADAVKAFATSNNLEVSVNDQGGFTVLKGGELGADVQVSCQDGKLVCSDEHLREKLSEIIMDMPIEPWSQENKTIMPTQARKVNCHIAKPDGILTPRDVIDYINPKATEQEAYLFAEFCKRKGADPMTKQVYLVVYEGQSGRNVSFIAGKEYFTEKAEAHPQFDGMKAGIIVRPKDGGPLEYREGEFWMSDEEVLLGGWAEIARKDRTVSFKAAIPRSEYDTKKNQWASKPGTMCRKVAIVHGLREAFPASLGGMYDSSEMNQAGVADLDPEMEVKS